MDEVQYVFPDIKRSTAGFFETRGAAARRNVCDEIDGVSVARLTDEFGSPLFVFSEARLREKYRDAQRAFRSRYPRVQFAWPYKTNYLNAVCSVFHDEGAMAEVVSDFEYEKARNLGVPGDKIIFNGPGKTPAMLRRAVVEGAKIQIDNFREIADLEQAAGAAGRPLDVAIRVNIESGSDPKWSKFGFSYESGEALRAVKRLVSGGRLRLVGLHAHIGSFILDPQRYRTATAKLVALAADVGRHFDIDLEYLNAGGGFASSNTLHSQYLSGRDAAPSFDQYAEAICATLHEKLPARKPKPMLYLEAGRALVDDAGYLVSTVVDSRRGAEGGRSMIIDAGVNLLYTAAWYKFDVLPAQDSRGAVDSTVVFGPLCANVDVIRSDAPLPPMLPGDRVVIHPVGAYNITQSMQFITYRPAVVMVGTGGEIDVIRQRETLADVERLEAVPTRLRSRK